MTLRYVAGISFPRSGHHLLVRLLNRYFHEIEGARFVYCDFYPPERDCCRIFPCSRNGVTFSKNHDFGGAANADVDVPQLVQYREFLPAVVSDFELFVRGKPDTASAFRGFATTKARMWGEFVTKWVDADFSGERLVIPYEDLTRDPVAWLGQAVTLFGGTVDRGVLEEVVRSEQAQAVTSGGEVWTANAGVVNTRRVQDFRFYDAAVFELVQAQADDARRAAASRG